MRILLVVKGLGLGGAERQVADIASWLVARNHEVTVAYFLSHKVALAAEIRAAGAQVVSLSPHPRVTATSVVALHSLLRTWRPDVVHAHLPVPGLLLRVLKIAQRYRLVYTEHNVVTRLHPIVRYLNLATYSLNDVTIACTRQVADGLGGRQAMVVENGVNLAEADRQCRLADRSGLTGHLGIPEDTRLLVCLANLVEKKNHRLLIDAVAGLSSRTRRNWHLLLVGQDGTERQRLEAQVRRLELGDRVTFWGMEPQPVRLLAACDGFVLSSTFEGLPIAVLEAMAVGLPVVATDVGGIAQVVRTGQTGFLVPSGDAVRFCDAILQLIEAPDMARTLGQNGRRLVEQNHSFESMMRHLMPLYRGAGSA